MEECSLLIDNGEDSTFLLSNVLTRIRSTVLKRYQLAVSSNSDNSMTVHNQEPKLNQNVICHLILTISSVNFKVYIYNMISLLTEEGYTRPGK